MSKNKDIEELISIDMFDFGSFFAMSIIDLQSFEVVYTNKAMKNIMADSQAKNCWEEKYGLSSPCMWCKAQGLMNNAELGKNNSSLEPEQYVTYENFNESANKWYQIKEKLTELKNGQQ